MNAELRELFDDLLQMLAGDGWTLEEWHLVPVGNIGVRIQNFWQDISVIAKANGAKIQLHLALGPDAPAQAGAVWDNSKILRTNIEEIITRDFEREGFWSKGPGAGLV